MSEPTARPPTHLLSILLLVAALANPVRAQHDDHTLRVFVFAGQSNMVGADSHVHEIARFPPFAGLDRPQKGVLFSYCIGREDKRKSDGWVDLQPVGDLVGPELSFAREVTRHIDAPIAIIKCAAGGTNLVGDWNPDEPRGFAMYPLTLNWIREALADLDRREIAYRLEGFVWHQGEGDMFEEGALPAYGANLARFLASWRRDLGAPELRFYIGELCTKTIWGMDLRPRMYAVRLGQRAVTDADPLARYVPTSHIGVQIGGEGGLHYHYGTLGQLEHGVEYADAYLETIGKAPSRARPLTSWPYAKGSAVRLFVLAGHRNMEGERAFVQDLPALGLASLARDNPWIAFEYDLGAGRNVSHGWEPLGPAGCYGTFGPELSFGARLRTRLEANVAIAKFTDSGSQIVDWTPEGSEAVSRNVYPRFVAFVREAMKELADRGHEVELAGIFYHLGENDMSYGPYRKEAAARLESLVARSREDLGLPALKWFVSQQRPTHDEGLDRIDVAAEVAKLAAADPNLTHIETFDLPGQEQQLVITTAGIVALGEVIADAYLKAR
ncbi:MAG TPA: sialate O-acetylesterase [Planctomycetota bacterium]|nr:sialate O-acetylesterase [Planctomycetota bacterium]